MNLAEFKGLMIEAGVDGLAESVMKSFINAGQRLLDRLCDYPHQQGTLTFTVAQGDFFLVFPSRVRIVHGVWLRDGLVGDEGTRLEKVDLIELRGFYPFPSDVTYQGTPSLYAHTTSVLASFGSPLVGELAVPTGDIDVSTDEPDDYKGLVLGPTPDATYYVDILCTAYSKELVDDLDMSFWTRHYPDILMNAVMFKIEGFFRNTSSSQSYFQAVMNDVRYLNYDAVEDELQDRPGLMGY